MISTFARLLYSTGVLQKLIIQEICVNLVEAVPNPTSCRIVLVDGQSMAHRYTSDITGNAYAHVYI